MTNDLWTDLINSAHDLADLKIVKPDEPIQDEDTNDANTK